MPDEPKPVMGAPAGETPAGEKPKIEEPKPKAPTPEEEHEELERTRVALKAANKEAADRRKRLDELEKAEADRQAASLSEVDKLKKQAADAEAKAKDAETKARERVIRAEVIAAASRLDFEDPEDAFAILKGKGQLADLPDPDTEEGGKALKALLGDLAKSKKHLLKQGAKAPSQRPTNPGDPTSAETLQQKRDRLMGKGSDVWDPDVMRNKGGGVVFNEQETKQEEKPAGS